MNNNDMNNDMNVMGHLQPTYGCSQDEIDRWSSRRNSNITVTDRSRESNFYQCKDIDDIHNCTQTNATDE